ncbi:unnamed protein product [Urochloa humidicola]
MNGGSRPRRRRDPDSGSQRPRRHPARSGGASRGCSSCLLRTFQALEQLDLFSCALLDEASLATTPIGRTKAAFLVELRRARQARASGPEALVAAYSRLEAVDRRRTYHEDKDNLVLDGPRRPPNT